MAPFDSAVRFGDNKNQASGSLNMLNNLRQFAIIGSFVTMLLMLPCISQAGGLYLNEFGTPSMGVAGAGAHVVASDASKSFHNAASRDEVDQRQRVDRHGWIAKCN
jgi:hypothetical protein